MATPVPFDARPLTEPVDRRAVRAYVRQLRATGRMPRAATAGLIVGAVVGGIFLLVFGTVLFGIIGAFVSMAAGGDAGSPLVVIVPPLIMLIVIAGCGVMIWAFATGRGGGATAYRLDRFAQANGMRWYPEADAPALPGMIFGIGHSRKATDIVRGERPRLVEFANYSYKTGSGKNETTSRWGYVAVKLQTPLPHIVLDAVGNDSFLGTNLPASFDRHQRLSLEGDFDEHFALYCPEGYERDALYLFTPDIMARFIDNAAALDVEIVDDWMFLYTQRPVSTLDPGTWAWLFSVVRALLEKLAQWERWRDDRLTAAAASAPPLPFHAPHEPLRPPPGVAPAGRRLKRGVPWGAIVMIVLFFGVFVAIQFGAFAGFAASLFGR